MITPDLENINTFLEEFDRQPTDSVSIESFLDNTGITITTFEDVIKAKRAFAKTYLEAAPLACSEECPKSDKEIQFIKKADVNEYLFIVDFDTIIALWLVDNGKINSLLKFIENIPEKATINVISMLPPETHMYIVPDIVMIGSLIRLLKGKTIFNFNAQLCFNDLFIASCCDELAVSQFAAISIVTASTTDNTLPTMQATYQEYIKGTYNYWIEKGLFTAEEVTNLFSSESVYSINLQSSEIKSRLNL